jgi:hypothetical protein
MTLDEAQGVLRPGPYPGLTSGIPSSAREPDHHRRGSADPWRDHPGPLAEPKAWIRDDGYSLALSAGRCRIIVTIRMSRCPPPRRFYFIDDTGFKRFEMGFRILVIETRRS